MDKTQYLRDGMAYSGGGTKSLQEVWEFKLAVDELIAAQIRGARSFGMSWADIGRAFGMSKQAIWERYRE